MLGGTTQGALCQSLHVQPALALCLLQCVCGCTASSCSPPCSRPRPGKQPPLPAHPGPPGWTCAGAPRLMLLAAADQPPGVTDWAGPCSEAVMSAEAQADRHQCRERTEAGGRAPAGQHARAQEGRGALQAGQGAMLRDVRSMRIQECPDRGCHQRAQLWRGLRDVQGLLCVGAPSLREAALVAWVCVCACGAHVRASCWACRRPLQSTAPGPEGRACLTAASQRSPLRKAVQCSRPRVRAHLEVDAGGLRRLPRSGPKVPCACVLLPRLECLCTHAVSAALPCACHDLPGSCAAARR